MRLEGANDTNRDASAISLIENSLLVVQFTDHKHLLIDMPSGSQKAATGNDQGVNTGQIPPQVAKPVLNGLADLGDPGPLFSLQPETDASLFMSIYTAYNQKLAGREDASLR
jgi:hypothetical protein